MDNLKKVEGCRKLNFSDTTVPIAMKLIGCHDVLRLIKFLISNLSQLYACAKTKRALLLMK